MKLWMSLCALLALITSNKAAAQLNGLQSVYFMNQYLANPSLAGMDKGLLINMVYQRQWTNLPGGPQLQGLTADYSLGDKVGVGINIGNDQAGLISRTRFVGTYAYHLQLNEANDKKLSFGVSFGGKNSYVDYSRAVGDPDDLQLQNFNQQGIYLDGDFGIAYTSKGLNIQGALPNLRNVVDRGKDELEVDRSVFYTAVSYKFQDNYWFGNNLLEPKLAYRGVRGFDNILDAGFLVGLTDYHLNFAGFYHSNKSLSLAVGLELRPMDILVSYNNNMGQLQARINNTIEFGLKLKLLRK